MAGKLTINIPQSPFSRTTTTSQGERPHPQKPAPRPLKTKPEGPRPTRRLRDTTDFESDYSDYSEWDESEAEDEGRFGGGRRRTSSNGAPRRRRSSAARYSILPSPGEYQALLESDGNPFSDDRRSVTMPADRDESSARAQTKSSCSSLSSSASSSSLRSQASTASSSSASTSSAEAAPKPRNRWAGFWGRAPSPPAKIRTVEIEVARPGWESSEETLLRLRREEDEAERAFEEDQREALDRLQSLGITDCGARCIDRD